ncbi:nephrin-like protein [Leptotrombidium deliense]|uniref:Nephrin-like protein n=1 Tax=Leptotrombidium deliense TaxID=299467 RepID=A0A443SBY3_9ACAR|nr:nephrin-like protein [Leptotrombidium deliense]
MKTDFSEATNSPICESNETIELAAKIGDKIEIVCDVRAKPNKLVFQWSLMDGNTDKELHSDDHITFTTNGEKGYLHIKANKMSHFRNYSCKARNSVGWQREPCVYRVHPSGVPKAPKSCTSYTKSNSTLHVNCDQHEQHRSMADYYMLEIYDTSNEKLVTAVNETLAPNFRVNGLQSNTSYVLVLYAVNENGRSNNVVLTIRFTGNIREQNVLHNIQDVKNPDIIPLCIEVSDLEPNKKVILNGPLQQIKDLNEFSNGLLNMVSVYSNDASVSDLITPETSTITEKGISQNYRSTPVR